MDYIIFIFITLTAIDFGIRIIKYAKTGDPKYKHEINRWREERKD